MSSNIQEFSKNKQINNISIQGNSAEITTITERQQLEEIAHNINQILKSLSGFSDQLHKFSSATYCEVPLTHKHVTNAMEEVSLMQRLHSNTKNIFCNQVSAAHKENCKTRNTDNNSEEEFEVIKTYWKELNYLECDAVTSSETCSMFTNFTHLLKRMPSENNFSDLTTFDPENQGTTSSPIHSLRKKK